MRSAGAGGGGWTPPTLEELARLLPQYQVESLLGRGGMGAVYKCRQSSLDRTVAIKLLPAEIAADQQFVARFQREARTLAKLKHARIVVIHDFGQTSAGHLYFVMEYIDGTDLRRILRGPGLEPEQALAIVGQLCDALQAAHQMGIVHRDIKPENVLVTSDGYVKLADFGLAQPPREEGATMLTGTHVILGTPSYMAPEQSAGAAKADPRSDIFSLGVMFYEMLTGHRPHGVFDPPSQAVQLDARIDEVVLKALQSEPERRYQSVVEFKGDVEHIRSTPPPPEPLALPEPATPATRPARAGWGRPVLAASLAVALGAGAAFALRSGFPVAPWRPADAEALSVPATPVTGGAAEAVSSAPTVHEPGFIRLFDETHLSGWKHCGTGHVYVQNGIAITSAGQSKGVYWYAARPFRNFVLRFDYWLAGRTSNSGVFVHFPPLSDDPRVAEDQGYEVQIHGDNESIHPTGEIVSFQAPSAFAQHTGWNAMEIKVIGQHFIVMLNGQKVNDFTGTRNLQGFIGFQDFPGAPAQFRNFRIKDL